MAQSLKAFEQMTAHIAAKKRTPPRVLAYKVPTLRLPIELKSNNITAGISQSSHGDPKSLMLGYHPPRAHRQHRR